MGVLARVVEGEAIMTAPTPPPRTAAELVEALRVRADCLSGQSWEVPATANMMREAADEIARLTTALEDKPSFEHAALHQRLFLAAYQWWRNHRPVAYTLEQHLQNPTTNTTTADEQALAVAVADIERLAERATGEGTRP